MSFYFLHYALRIKGFFSKKMHVSKPEVITFENYPQLEAPIVDLGGGGEGVIGQLYGNKVVAIDIRQDELDEAPDGPIKVCADAKNLPYEDNYFTSATAFYFFFYVKSDDFLPILKEAYRTLKPGGSLSVWDTCIPEKGNKPQSLYVVPVAAILPKKTVQTAYGVTWSPRKLNLELLSKLAIDAGFTIKEVTQAKNAFYLVCNKSA